MLRLTNCPSCAAAIQRTVPVVLAPFVRERIHVADPHVGLLSDCSVCGFRFFVDRYDPAETRALYRDYRGQEYLRQRHQHEFWYTRAFNDAMIGPAEIARRNLRLSKFLGDTGVLPGARSALDWGGDRGQFIPDAFAERFVYDVSGVQPFPGVTSLSLEEAGRRAYDLITLSHVLEHASDPVSLLRDVTTIASSHLYVEVPCEPWKMPRFHYSSEIYGEWVRASARSRWYPLLAFVSTAARVRLRCLPPFGVLQQHEHLNYFDSTSLVRVVERAGCRVLRTVSFRRHGDHGPVEALGVLAVPPALTNG